MSAWNPSDKSAYITLSESDRLATTGPTAPGWAAVRADSSQSASTADHYFEVEVVLRTGDIMIGVAMSTVAIDGSHVQPDAYWYWSAGSSYTNGSSAAYGSAFTTGDIVGVLLKNGRLYFSLNGTWQNSADPVAETGEAFSGLTGNFYPIVLIDALGDSARSRLTSGQQASSPPTGSAPWSGEVIATFADPSVRGSVLLAELYFDGGYHLQRVATDWWYSQPGDTIGVQEWADRVIAEPTYSVQLGCVAWGSKTSVTVGSIEVADPDGSLNWMQLKTRDALCVLRLAYQGQSYDQTRIVGRAIVDAVEMSGTSKVVRLRGIDTLLDRPLQTTLYAAASASTSSEPIDDISPPRNDAGGNAAIEGDRVPVVLGRCWQFEPVLTDTAQLRFQITDAGIVEISEVLSGGSVSLPPDSSDEEWDYANQRAGFRMTVEPSARITTNVDGIRALSASIISDRFNLDESFSSDGLANWTQTTTTSGQSIARIVDVGVQLAADAGESSGPSISRAIAASEYDWVVVLIDVLDISDGYLTLSLGSPVEIQREGKHAFILPMGAGADLEIAGVPDETGCDVTIGSVYAYLLESSTGTESIVEMMRHITIARGALPDADVVSTVVIGAAEGDFNSDIADWDVTTQTGGVGTASGTWSAGEALLQADKSAVGSGAAAVVELTSQAPLAAGTFDYSVSYDVTIPGAYASALLQVLFVPDILVTGDYINFGYVLATGAGTISGTFSTAVAGRFQIRAAAASLGSISATVDNVRLTRVDVDEAGATVDFHSLTEIDAGYTFGLASDSSTTVRDAATQLLDSVCGWIYPDSAGRIRFGRLAEPEGQISLTISEANLVSRPVYSPDLAPGLSDTMSGARNWSPYGDQELAGITYPNRPPFRSEYRAKRRGASAERMARPYTHAVGAESIPTLIYDAASVQAEIDRLTALYTVQRGFWSCDVALGSAAAAAEMRPGMTVQLDDPLFGDDDGKLCRVVGVEGRYRSQVVSLTLWGAVSG